MRLALSVLGVALSIMLITFLAAFAAGIYERAGAYLQNSPGSVVVLPEGVRSMAATSSLLPAASTEAVADIEGVAGVTPVLIVPAVPELHGRKETVAVVGYDPALGGGPWAMAKGREPQADDEIVIDRVLAKRHNIQLGELMEAAGRRFRVVGLSSETSSFSGSYVFARKDAVESLILAPGAASILLVTPADGIAAATLRDRLQALPGADALLKEDVIANDRELTASIYDSPLLLMLGTAFVVGALVVGLVIYTATVDRRREYGVLKALGARNGVLYRVVVAQALTAALAGCLLGVILAYGFSELVMYLRPKFLILIEPEAILRALAAGLVMAALGALVPARTLAGVAPAEVFRR